MFSKLKIFPFLSYYKLCPLVFKLGEVQVTMHVQKGVERKTRFSIFKLSVFKLWEPANYGINQIVGTIILGLLLNDGLCVKAICWDRNLVYFNLQWPHELGNYNDSIKISTNNYFNMFKRGRCMQRERFSRCWRVS